MTPADLKALEEAATPGPWEANVDDNETRDYEASMYYGRGPFTYDETVTVRKEDRLGYKSAMADARLIAAIRNLAPELAGLWGMANDHTMDHENCGCGLCVALHRLNHKAREL